MMREVSHVWLPRPLDLESDALPPGHPAPLDIRMSRHDHSCPLGGKHKAF